MNEKQKEDVLKLIQLSLVTYKTMDNAQTNFNAHLKRYLKKYKNHTKIVAIVIGENRTNKYDKLPKNWYNNQPIGIARNYSPNQYIVFKIKKYKILFAVKPFKWFLKYFDLDPKKCYIGREQSKEILINLLTIKEIKTRS